MFNYHLFKNSERLYQAKVKSENFKEILRHKVLVGSESSFKLKVHPDNQQQFEALTVLFPDFAPDPHVKTIDESLFYQAFPVAGWSMLHYFENLRIQGPHGFSTPGLSQDIKSNNLQLATFLAKFDDKPETFKQYCDEIELYFLANNGAHYFDNESQVLKDFLFKVMVEINKNYTPLDIVTPFGLKMLLKVDGILEKRFENYVEKDISYKEFVRILNDSDNYKSESRNPYATDKTTELLTNSNLQIVQELGRHCFSDEFKLNVINEVKKLNKDKGEISLQLAIFVLNMVKTSERIRIDTEIVKYLPNFSECLADKARLVMQNFFIVQSADNIMNVANAELGNINSTKPVSINCLKEMFHEQESIDKIIIKIFESNRKSNQKDLVEKIFKVLLEQSFIFSGLDGMFKEEVEDLNRGLINFFPDCYLRFSQSRNAPFQDFINGFDNYITTPKANIIKLITNFMNIADIKRKDLINTFTDFTPSKIDKFLESDFYKTNRENSNIKKILHVIDFLNRDGDLDLQKPPLEII